MGRRWLKSVDENIPRQARDETEQLHAVRTRVTERRERLSAGNQTSASGERSPEALLAFADIVRDPQTARVQPHELDDLQGVQLGGTGIAQAQQSDDAFHACWRVVGWRDRVQGETTIRSGACGRAAAAAGAPVSAWIKCRYRSFITSQRIGWNSTIALFASRSRSAVSW